MPYAVEEIEEMIRQERVFCSILAMVTNGPKEEISQKTIDECEAIIEANPTETECYNKLIVLSESSGTTSLFVKTLLSQDLNQRPIVLY